MEIYNHDSPEAITYKNNYEELENWIDHLNYIKKEIGILVNLGIGALTNKSEYSHVLLKFMQEKEDNEARLKDLQKYKDDLPRVAECEDVECDMFFVNEHEKFRKTYMKHLESYRVVKEEYFNVLKKKRINETQF
jgi:hypothetical protein